MGSECEALLLAIATRKQVGRNSDRAERKGNALAFLRILLSRLAGSQAGRENENESFFLSCLILWMFITEGFREGF